MKTTKLASLFVLFLLCGLIFAVAQGTTEYEGSGVEPTEPQSSELIKPCNIGCKAWKFLFGSKEARAGRAWFDRSEPLVGQAGEYKNYVVTYKDKGGELRSGLVVATSSSEAESRALAGTYGITDVRSVVSGKTFESGSGKVGDWYVTHFNPETKVVAQELVKGPTLERAVENFQEKNPNVDVVIKKAEFDPLATPEAGIALTEDQRKEYGIPPYYFGEVILPDGDQIKVNNKGEVTDVIYAKPQGQVSSKKEGGEPAVPTLPKQPASATTAPKTPVSPQQTAQATALREEARVLQNHGYALDKQGKTQEAKAKYQEALWKIEDAVISDPTNYKNHGVKGNILWNLGQYDKAAQSYNAVLTIPNIPPDARTKAENDRNEAIKAYANSGAKLAEVFTLAGYSGAGKDSDGYKAKEALYQKLTGKKDYTGSPEQNDLVLNAIKEGTETVPFKSGGQVPSASIGYKPAIDPKAKSQLESALGGSTYESYAKNLKANDVFARPDGTLVMRGAGGVITVKEDKEHGVQIAERSQGGKLLETSILKEGQILATQTADGRVKVKDSSYNFPKGKALDESLDDLKEGIQLPGKEGPSGLLKLDEGVFTAVNYEEESLQRINSKTKESESLKVDYYQRGVSGCKTDGGCYVETGGEVIINIDGKAETFLVDHEYDTPFGADRKLEQKELFDPRTGRKNGIELTDGTRIVKREKNDQGEQIYLVADKDGTTIKAKKVNDNWHPVSSPTNQKLQELKEKGKDVAQSLMDTQNKREEARIKVNELASKREIARLQEKTTEEERLASLLVAAEAERNALEGEAGMLGKKLNEINTQVTKEEAAAKEAENVLRNKLNSKENQEALKELETEETLAGVNAAIQSIYSITNNLKSYPAISNLLFGEADFYKKWRSDMDKAFAPLLASNWFPSDICEKYALHWKDIEPEGKAVIKTTSGTYQAVASIQMERSPESSPILCHKNPDEESEELFICDSRQVCVDNNFCYHDQDRDNEPDSKEPLKGYFYKVTWAVTSPQDEAFTPLVDENGVAVSFNIFLYPGVVPMYNLNGNIASPIQLQNGASDRDAIIKYSANVYDQACIRWNQAPISIGVAGRDGAAVGYGAIEDVCFNVVTSAIGQVNWERSGQNAASVTVSHGEISRNTDW